MHQKKYTDWLSKIEYTPDLNGGGAILAPIFGELLSGRKYGTVLEWCAGPAWIGFWLLELGICEELVTCDINGASVRMVKKTAKRNGYNVRAYTSNNLDSIPSHEKFDLVVANPPNYCNIQRTHPHGHLRDDLRPSDIDWKIHRNFYDNIGPHLHTKSEMLIFEVAPYDKEVHIGGAMYDSRPDTPMEDFTEMANENNLEIVEAIPVKPFGADIDCRVLKIRPAINFKSSTNRAEESFGE